ncbi:MAG: SIS domain-containing protein [Nitrosarchaeum sp.]|nr:SIS domain-containing protein [Nitrosarchaeum sp.]
MTCLKAGRKILVRGNGGSAADAQHFVAELTIRFERERRPLPAICLNANTSSLTAGANDYGYERVFSRQIQALGNKGDVLIAITTSGTSRNILEALKTATEQGLHTICLNGRDGGKVTGVTHNIIVLQQNTARIQESHIAIIHTWCALIDDAFGDAS